MSITNILLTVITIAISVIAMKITFSFDINKYLENRDEKLKSKIKNYCTHVEAKEVDEQIGIQSLFVSPPGTTNWICQRCGLQIFYLNRTEEDNRLKYFLENPKEYFKQEKMMMKLMKKVGII